MNLVLAVSSMITSTVAVITFYKSSEQTQDNKKQAELTSKRELVKDKAVMAGKLSRDYPAEEMRTMEGVCKDVTNSNCSEFKDQLSFAISFAKSRGNVEKWSNEQVTKTINENNLEIRKLTSEQEEIVDRSRRSIHRYYNDLIMSLKYGLIDSNEMDYPGANEHINFLKLHWMVYHVNSKRNNAPREARPYAVIKSTLSKSNQEAINQYQQKLWGESFMSDMERNTSTLEELIKETKLRYPSE